MILDKCKNQCSFPSPPKFPVIPRSCRQTLPYVPSSQIFLSLCLAFHISGYAVYIILCLDSFFYYTVSDIYIRSTPAVADP